MLELTCCVKPVHRRTGMPHRLARRKIIISLLPGDMVGFREEKRREMVTCCVHDLYTTALQWHINFMKRKKKEEKKAKKLGLDS